MDLALSPEQEATRRTVAEWVDAVVAPHAIRNDREERFPQEALDGLKRDGWVGLTIPEEYGGGGADPLTYCLVIEELGRGDANVRSLLSVHLGLVGGSIVRWGTEEQKQEWLPRMATGETLGCFCLTEPDHGSDPAGLEATAVKEGDSYRINGSKIFITNGVYGDIYIVAARTDAEAKGSRGISLFIVEKENPGLKVTRKFDKHGWRSSDTAELFFDDMLVPQDALLGEEGKGFYYIMSTFQNERLVVGALSSGTSAKAIELTVDYLRQRVAFGKPLWDQPVVRNKLASVAAKAAAVRAMTYQCAQMIEQGMDTVREVSMLKAFGAETLQEVVHTCLQLHGGTGYIIGTPVERMARDARILTIGGGATEVMLEEVAKRM
jgi:acyl-CoA dehydrogenase